MRVLVVDDNEDAAISVAMVLGLDGHAVETVFHPTQALEVATRFRPEVALLDLGLPEMDGYELARRLLALPGLSGLHLIALSGHGQAEDKRRAGDAGFAQHLMKPADMDALYAALAVARDGRVPGRASARPSSNA
jgi:two-component system CheB/CheR fusion protein